MRSRAATRYAVISTLPLAIVALVSTAVFAQSATAPATDKSGAAAPAAKSDAAATKTDAAAPKTDAAGATPDAAGAEPAKVNPQELLDKGEAALKANDFNAAIAAFNQLENIAKNNVGPQAEQLHFVALTGRGRAFLGMKENESALRDFTTVLSENQNFGPALLARGKLLLDANSNEDALADFQAAFLADPSNLEALVGYGHALVVNGRAGEAVAPLTRAITADPKNAEAYRYRGMAEASQNKIKPAVDDLEQAIKLNPDDYETYFVLGLVYNGKEDYQAAAEQFAKAIEHYKPKPGPQEDMPYVAGYIQRSNTLVELGKQLKDNPAKQKAAYRAALDDAQKIITQIDPKNTSLNGILAESLYSRGSAERMLGEIASAIRTFSKAIELNPEMDKAYFRRGVCFTLINEDRMAIADFQAAAHIAQNNNQHDPRSNMWEGFANAKLGDYHEALRAYGDAIAASDRYTPAYYNRALTYIQLGEYNKAIIDFNDAIRLDPTNAEYYFKRGLAYQLQGDNKRAAESFATAIEFDKTHAGANRHMGDVQQALGRTELASQYRQKADQLAPKKTP
jgi:tetratricopeptide (TPR) repeat protein